MKKNNTELTIFALSQPLWSTEWASLRGDKFRNALPFPVRFVSNIEEAQVIAWNGMLTPKSSSALKPLIEKLNHGSILLLMGERRTLLEGHPFVKFANSSKWRVVELPGWSVLPEEMLKSIHECWELISHV